MGLFGGSSKSVTTTQSFQTDSRTAAQDGGVAAQNVQGDVILTQTADGVVELLSETLRGGLRLAENALDQSIQAGQAAIDGQSQALDVVSNATGNPSIKPLMILGAVAIVAFAMRGKLL